MSQPAPTSSSKPLGPKPKKPAKAPAAGFERLTASAIRMLLCILFVGALVRFVGTNWDQQTGQHPDERHILMSTWRLGWPASLAEYFNEAESPLNPRNRKTHFFAYGTLPGSLLKSLVEMGSLTRPEQMTIAGRLLSAFTDTAAILLVFLLAWQLYRRQNIALLAAFFYAIAVLPIQHAHFFVVDPFANFFVLAALYFLAVAWRSGRFLAYGAVGVCLGLALSCKISVATFGLPVALVSLLPTQGKRINFRQIFGIALVRTAFFSLATIITLRIALPDAFSGFWPWELAPRWVANMREVIAISTGVTDIPFTRQFVGRIPLLWPLSNMILWGLGVGLGLTAWIAWGIAVWQLARKQAWQHAIPVLWIATVFFHQGLTFQATLRYFLPIYGCLCLLAAWLLVKISTKRANSRPLSLWLGRTATVVVVILSGAWMIAFCTIYHRPHTRVEASNWIYEHVPKGSVLLVEHWDDNLPLPLPGDRNPSDYTILELPLYDQDNALKRGELLQKLNEGEFIILASQKLRDSIPRMPHRYPMTISYYEGLEDGSLGFDRVAIFERKLPIFGYPISTRGAEEAFSVYDHPPVVIYQKSERYDPELLVERFNTIALEKVVETREPPKSNPTPVQAEKPETSILLSPEHWAEAQSLGTWSEMFDRNSFAAKHPILVWCGMLVLLQIIGWGLLSSLLKALPDHGAGLARPFALMIPCWLLWLLASTGLARFDRPTYWSILGLFLLAAFALSWRDREHWRRWWIQGRRTFLRVELVFWLGFLWFLWVRSGNPDLWHEHWGGEKPMEMTFLYGVLKSEQFPPMNPWFAGGFINYYYFGFVLCGSLIKALGVLPEVGFNLCLATFFGMACAATFSATRALMPRGSWLPAWTATAFVMVLGNLFQVRFIWQRLVALGAQDHELTFPLVSDLIRAGFGFLHLTRGVQLSNYPESDLYWVAARAILGEDPAPITEFPYWSFLYGDLHPHLIALPFTLCVIALVAAWLQTKSTTLKAGILGLIALTLGFFWPTNTWDWPTYGALTGLVLFLGYWQKDLSSIRGFLWAGVKSVTIFAFLLLFGRLAFLPFFQNYVSGYGTFERWTGPKTSLTDYLVIHGLFLFIFVSALVAAWKHRTLRFTAFRLWFRISRSYFKPGQSRLRLRLLRLGLQHPWSAVASSATLFLSLLGGLGILSGSLPTVLMIGIVAALCVIWRNRSEALQAVPGLLILIGFTLSLLVEFFVLVGDVGRMNMVFKFYYQVWVCFGLAAALALPQVLRSLPRWKAPTRWAWRIAFAALVAAAWLYPLLATPTKINDRVIKTRRTLDGLVFAEQGTHRVEDQVVPLSGDLKAIRWLQDNIEGSPVILEMNMDRILYKWGSRFSIHTGLPSIVGWSWHQRQQQAGLKHSTVDDRIADVLTIYRTADPELARELMKKYGVRLVIVGELERIYATPEGIQKFESMGLEKMYDSEGVVIYRVP